MGAKQILWLFIGSLILGLVLILAWYFQLYTSNTRTLNDVTVTTSSLNVGEIRKGYDNGTDGLTLFDKEELAAKALLKVAGVQKDHNLDIKVEYAFLDKDENVTEEDANIRSIQIRVSYLKLGKTTTSVEKRFEINELIE